MSDRFTATYRIETAHPLEEAADAMAGEQSSGTFVDVSGETESLRERHAARVESIDPVETVDGPTLPGTTPPDGYDDPEADSLEYLRAEVVLSFPVENVGCSLENLVTTVAGNLFELRHLSGIRLLDVAPPASLVSAYPGPAFGIEGTRDLLGVYDRPIVGTIVKPSVGLSPAATADLVGEMVDAGIDFVKDDELIADPPYSPIEDRVTAVMGAIDEYTAPGEEVMYACNVTGDVDEMLERHDRIRAAGGNCVMVSLNSVGLAGVAKLARHSELPIHGHRNGWGGLSRCPQLGFEYEAWQKFWRIAGVDHLHVNGIRNKFCESDASVVSSARECQTPIVSEEDVVMPVFSSGQWAEQAADTYEALGNTDLMYLAGGGIQGHPDGPSAGVAAIRQGWAAALEGIPLEEYARDHEELRRAIEAFADDE